MVCSVVAGSFLSYLFFPAKLSVDLRRELVAHRWTDFVLSPLFDLQSSGGG
jgi:hypothetical protein